MVTLEAKAAFIDKIHIFRRMDDDTLFEIAARFKEVTFRDGDIILRRGEQADAFYLVYLGKVALAHGARGQKNIILTRGDYLGVDALLPREKNNPNAKAEGDVTLLRLSKQDFATLKKAIPYLKENLQVSIKGQRLTKKIHFDWVREDERIYFLARKHPILFWKKMVFPVLVFPVLLALFWMVFVNRTMVSPFVFAGLATLLWLARVWWIWEDWRNDYYIITNKRVVWLEKVIGIHDSRQEAPLEEVLSVGADADFWGRFFDYGHVNVRTFVGNIHLRHINHPHQARHMINELAQRQKMEAHFEEINELKKAIKKRLEQPIPVEEKKKKKKKPKKKKKKSFWERNAEKKHKETVGLFKMRFEEGKTITYRKHWIVLVQQAGLPSALCFLFFGFTVYELVKYFFPSPDSSEIALALAVLLAFFTMVFFFWSLYQYVDWSNDIFQVTEDKIFDIDRTPLGDVQSRSAPLENIHSTEYKRIGLLSYLFNYGTVYIEIGTADFTFEDVMDPAAVQQDIDRRRMNHINKKKKIDIKKERERMVDWMLAYHQSSEELRMIDNANQQPAQDDQIDDTDIYME
ncbi:MAG: cyclic nucleotide-binding domain-containing protein [Anaerolineales bacterium]|nr:cyclic nucleotide-binding domain-containing protein [Anaerolineales bacterium]